MSTFYNNQLFPSNCKVTAAESCDTSDVLQTYSALNATIDDCLINLEATAQSADVSNMYNISTYIITLNIIH